MTAYMEWEAQFLLWMQERLRKDRLTKWVRRITQLGNGGLIWLSIACLLFAVRPQRLLAATVITAQSEDDRMKSLLDWRRYCRRRKTGHFRPDIRLVPCPQVCCCSFICRYCLGFHA